LKPSHLKPLIIIAICCLGIAIYSNTFNSSFHLDDYDSITDNPAIKNIRAPLNIWGFWPTRFITYLSLALNYHLHKLDVFGYHLFNLAVHLGSSILVWWLMLLTFSTPALKGQKIARHAKMISFFAGLLFVSHPLQTQAVTYIVQRAVSMAALFYLASLSLYVKSRLLEYEKPALRLRRRWR
jgi:protein O-mannosyl-transferase